MDVNSKITSQTKGTMEQKLKIEKKQHLDITFIIYKGNWLAHMQW